MTDCDAIKSLLQEIGPNEASPNDRALKAVVLGPCTVESVESLESVAVVAAQAGATHLRGGGFKLRTSCQSFSGLGIEGWRMLHHAARARRLLAVSEVTDIAYLEQGLELLDVLQLGARSMWNHALLDAMAASGRPMIIKRGIGATTTEWLHSALRARRRGCRSMILCERGVRAVDGASRNAVDLAALLILTGLSLVPVWLDVSHSSGHPVPARRMLACAWGLGVDGVMAELHASPRTALCDGHQALEVKDVQDLVARHGKVQGWSLGMTDTLHQL